MYCIEDLIVKFQILFVFFVWVSGLRGEIEITEITPEKKLEIIKEKLIKGYDELPCYEKFGAMLRYNKPLEDYQKFRSFLKECVNNESCIGNLTRVPRDKEKVARYEIELKKVFAMYENKKNNEIGLIYLPTISPQLFGQEHLERKDFDMLCETSEGQEKLNILVHLIACLYSMKREGKITVS